MSNAISIITLAETLEKNKDSQKLAMINVADQSRITYADLYSQVIDVAGQLQQKGLKKGDAVVVQSSKSIQMIVAAFAIFRCGAVFAPVDIEIPSKRLRHIIAQSGAKLVLSEKESESAYRNIWFVIDAVFNDAKCSATEFSAVPLEAADPAYVIFTSGSTGLPKGVMISHASAVAFLRSAQQLVEYEADLKFLNISPLFFDASILDVYLTLSLGGELYLLPKVVFPSDITRAIEAHRITDTLMVSSVLKLLVNKFSDVGKRDLSSLRSIWYGAEPCPVSVLKALQTHIPGVRYIHGYGPTETTHTALLYVCDDLQREVNEYLPLADTLSSIDVLLVDENQQPVDGVGVGELLIGGEQVMLGYINDESLSRSAFTQINGKKYYKSNDLLKRDELGDFRFVGRKDHAIKVKGMLVHLDEIECTTLTLPGIEYAYATHIEHPLHGKLISLFAVANEAVSKETISHHLSEFLPAYMLPTNIQIIPSDECQFLPSGKLDRNWLANSWNQEESAS